MVLRYTWVIGKDGSAAKLSLKIGIIVQTGVLILSASINPTQSCTGLLLCVCACVKCMLKLYVVMHNYASSS